MAKTQAQKDAEAKAKAKALANGIGNEDKGIKPNSSVPPAGAEPKSDKIEVSREMLMELIESNKEMKKSIEVLNANASATSGMGNNGPMVLRKNRDIKLHLLKWNDQYFLGYQNMGRENKPLYVYKEYNAQTRENVEFVNVILEGSPEPIKMEYVTFLREAERVEVLKVSQVERETVIEQGMVYKKDFAENGYGMFETMVQVPVEIISKEYTYTVKLPAEDGGRELVIDGKWVNN